VTTIYAGSDQGFIPNVYIIYKFHYTSGHFMHVHELHTGVRGSVVVKALCYKPEGCGFETR
jgi:hypothetical protein